MKKFALPFVATILAILTSSPVEVQAANRDVTGTIFNDPNGNNRLDNNEKGGAKATVWLYRILPNGSRRKVGKMSTDQAGNYTFKNVKPGKYVIAIRYSTNKLAVRTRPFTIGGKGNSPYRANFPFVTNQTLKRYPSLTQTPNPANLDQNESVSPFAP
ncbi:MAG: hypothetical protein KDN18_06360 [Verrucomicrobiae bacterium]|nr:hypothetical protein [Verrucomicrobiae bacterium]